MNENRDIHHGSVSPTTIQALVDSTPFGGYRWIILILCFFAVFVDGFSTGSMAFIAPALVQEWGVPKSALGPLLSAVLVGLALGALSAGPLADRQGRKLVLTVSVLLFGLASCACALSSSLTQLTVLRLLTGLGLGGAMPNAITLMSEYVPNKRRGFLVTLMFCGYTLGSSLGGLIVAATIASIGWRGIFLSGGLITIALAAVMTWLLPESLLFLSLKRGAEKQIHAVLGKLGYSSVALIASEHSSLISDTQPSGIALILGRRFRQGTLLLWGAFFMGLAVIYLLTSWMPLILRGAGLSVSAAALIASLFQLGGTGGALVVGWAMDKVGDHIAVSISYFLGALCVLLVGRVGHDVRLLSAAVLAAGFFMSGAQTPMNALAAEYYPTQARATGVGWMTGIGRWGGVAGAYMGAALLPLGFPSLFEVLSVPAVVACVAIAIKGYKFPNAVK